MSEFIRPQVSVEEISDNIARITAEPLERGYGDTLGNSLRRVLLSSLEGAAVEAIKIDGVQKESTRTSQTSFSTSRDSSSRVWGPVPTRPPPLTSTVPAP